MPTLNKEIKFKSKEHRKIVHAVTARERYSAQQLGNKFEDWRESEEHYHAYVHETADDAHRRSKREAGKPQYTTIQIPMSYAILMSIHTYQTNVFLGRNPIFQYTGRHGEPQQSVQAIEALMDYQVQVGKQLVPYYCWILDADRYGIGVLGNYWDEKYSAVTSTEEVPETYLGIPIPGGKTKIKRTTRKVKSYSGNAVYNIRPYDWRPDPRVPMTYFQKGEFCGVKTKIGWSDLVAGEQDKKYFNVDIVKKRLSGHHLNETEQGAEMEDMPTDFTPGFDTMAEGADTKSSDRGMVDIIEMVIKVVPKDWGLGGSEYPEKWVFTVAENEILIGCRPLGALHDQFPYSILEVEMDAYALFKRGVMQILEPLQHTMDWLINTHFYNVRAILNDQIVADPSRIVMKDLKGGPGRVIRAQGMAFGEDVRKAIMQLPLTDVTKSHMEDMTLMGEMMQRVAGVNDTIMGMVNEGGRKTATEIRSSSSSSVNRMKTQTEYMSALGFAPLSEMLLSNTQQYYDMEENFKIAGDLYNVPGAMEGTMKVTPDDIAGFFDFVPVDGTMPVDRFAQAQLWKELTEMANMVPQIGQNLDMLQIFYYTAQLAGAKNIHQFKLQVRPDQDIQRDVQAGNLQTVGEANGQPASNPDGTPNRNAEELAARAAQTGNVGGMGPAG